MGTLNDPKGELDRLHPDARRAVRRLVRAVPFTLQVRSGRRSCAQQYDLYGIGRRYNVGSPPVTYAEGCRSWHVLARAVDLDIMKGGKAAGTCAEYTQMGEVWERMGGIWGGRWGGFGACGDAGHFEWHPGITIKQACPDPAQCEAVSRQIDAEIAAAQRFDWVGPAALGTALGIALGWAASELR